MQILVHQVLGSCGFHMSNSFILAKLLTMWIVDLICVFWFVRICSGPKKHTKQELDVIKNQPISPKWFVGIPDYFHQALLNFLDYKQMSELLKTFFCTSPTRRFRVKNCKVTFKKVRFKFFDNKNESSSYLPKSSTMIQ